MGIVKGLSHVGMFCHDLEKMRAFYVDVLGLREVHVIPGRGVFLAVDPETEDHDIALWAGREGDAKLLEQISFRVATVEDVRRLYQAFKAMGLKIDSTLTHGAEVSCYFFDPEGNRLEVFADVLASGYRTAARSLDLDRPADELIAEVAQGGAIRDGLAGARVNRGG